MKKQKLIKTGASVAVYASPCPSEAIELVLKPENNLKTPPVTSAEQMMNMAIKRGIQF